MARVDSLPEAVKKLLQTGSVIGREFGYELIREVMGVAEKELLSHLSVLKDSELLYERGIYPQSTYIFKHALTQDAAYGSLMKSTRQKYHKEVAQVLERRFPKAAELQPELLGHHYTEAGLVEQAIPYWQRAGDIAVNRSAHKEAAGHFGRGLELIKELPETPERAQGELELQTAYGTALMAIKGFGAPEVKQALVRARELCEMVEDTPKLFEILHGLWIFYLTQAELSTSQQIAEQLLKLAEQFKDPASVIEAHHVLGSNYWWCGKYDSAQTHNEQTIALYDSQPKSSRVLLPGREDPGVMCRTLAAKGMWSLGYPDQAVKKIVTAIDLAQELSHPFSAAYALLSAALIHLMRREGQQAQRRAEETISLSEEQGFALWLAWSTALRGSSLAMQGRDEEGIADLKKGIAACQATGTILSQMHLSIFLAEVYGKMGKIDNGHVELDKAQTIIGKNDGMFYDSELYRIRGELLLLKDVSDHQGAETHFRKALDVARRRQSKSVELRASVSLSRLWQKQGKRDEARRLLSEIYGWFTEGFDTADLKEAKALLDELS
jgi:predicted ATPase